MAISITAHNVTRIETRLIRHEDHVWRRVTVTFGDGSREEIDLFTNDRPLAIEDLDAASGGQE